VRQKAKAMSGLATLERLPAAADEESAKRRQIVDGARAVFLAQGFDAASMNDIARAAGVSKGTLYVYFKHKEQLFEAIVEQECEGQAEGIFDLDPNDHDVEAVLTRLGFAYIRFLCRPEKASAIRTVIAIAERMPELGRKFYESGPAKGIAKLAAYIAAQVDAGVLAVDDGEVAAAQLMEAYQAMLFKSMVFNFVREPSAQQIERVVLIAVKVFLAAYRAPATA
jgi:AcrR family transcriptional regulator